MFAQLIFATCVSSHQAVENLLQQFFDEELCLKRSM